MALDGIIAAGKSAIAVVGASALTILFTKQKERDFSWQEKQLSYYEEFLKAARGIVGASPLDAKTLCANAVNNLHLVGSSDVIKALHALADAIARSRPAPLSKEEDDLLWSRLVWEIRRDPGTLPEKDPARFEARLWASGTTDKRPVPRGLQGS